MEKKKSTKQRKEEWNGLSPILFLIRFSEGIYPSIKDEENNYI